MAGFFASGGFGMGVVKKHLDPCDDTLGCCLTSKKKWGEPVLARSGESEVFVRGNCLACGRVWIRDLGADDPRPWSLFGGLVFVELGKIVVG
jgi:hypothetical protein